MVPFYLFFVDVSENTWKVQDVSVTADDDNEHLTYDITAFSEFLLHHVQDSCSMVTWKFRQS